jgi:hypothetical protein
MHGICPRACQPSQAGPEGRVSAVAAPSVARWLDKANVEQKMKQTD